MNCPVCGPGTPISTELVSTAERGNISTIRKVRKCEVCHNTLSEPEAETVGAAETSPSTAQWRAERAAKAGVDLSKVPPRTPKPQPSPMAARATKSRCARAVDFDVIQAARAQLKELNREIRRLEKLRVKRDKLKRLLDAADGKSLAVVRNIKKATG